MSGPTVRYDLPVAPEDVEVTAARLWAAGATGVWERPGAIVAWFPAADGALTDAATPDAATLGLPTELAGGTVTLEPDRDWQAEWKATVSVVRAGRFAVVPTWRIDEHVADDDETTLVLDPGRAFGSGHHATTALCLELLDELELTGRTVADVGCGSGVLAIAAATRGAIAVGSDVDPDAIEVTDANAARNRVAVPAARGSVAAALALLDAPAADVVVANLVTDTVAALADDLVAAAGADGTLVLSGIAADRADVALDPLVAAGAEVVEIRERDGWIAVLARPRPSGRGAAVAPEAPGERGSPS